MLEAMVTSSLMSVYKSDVQFSVHIKSNVVTYQLYVVDIRLRLSEESFAIMKLTLNPITSISSLDMWGQIVTASGTSQ